MAKGGVEIIGLAGLRQRIEQAIQAHAGQIEKTLSEIGDVGVQESALRAPVDEGMLTESIEKHLGEDADGPAVNFFLGNGFQFPDYLTKYSNRKKVGKRCI